MTDDKYVIKNLSEIQNNIIDELKQIIDSKITDEISNYSLYKIDFENITINIDNCYDYSYIEQSILEHIRALNNKTDMNNDHEFYSVYDVFSQEYKFES